MTPLSIILLIALSLGLFIAATETGIFFQPSHLKCQLYWVYIFVLLFFLTHRMLLLSQNISKVHL